MDNPAPHLTIVPPVDYDRRPDCIEMLRANARQRPTLAADWREFWSEVAAAPAHHAAFGLLILVSVAVLFVAPVIIAGWFV